LQQIGITSYSWGGCAANNDIPWYVRTKRFKWGIDDLIINYRWGPWAKFGAEFLKKSDDSFARTYSQTAESRLTGF